MYVINFIIRVLYQLLTGLSRVWLKFLSLSSATRLQFKNVSDCYHYYKPC